MMVELVTTGSELLLGEIVNTNAAYLARELNAIGFDVVYQTTVGDNRARMQETIRHALSRADIVITSGGLGPTQGDITKEVCAGVLGRKLQRHEATVQRLQAWFARQHREMTGNNLRQAMLPEGAHVLENPVGTAPGIVLEQDGRLLVNLPGPPSEMKAMFTQSLTPFLMEKFGTAAVILSRELHTQGIGESLLETRILDLIRAQRNPTLALLVRPTGVLIRITAKAQSSAAAQALIDPLEQELRERIGEFIYAVDGAAMEDIVGAMLREQSRTIACAESCTGGLLTSRLTDVAGSSAYVMGSVISYTNEVKAELVGVEPAVLAAKGAVSEEVARQMAEGIRQTIPADIGVGVTGIAGPGGGSAEKPVGLVYIAVSTDAGTECTRNVFMGDRREVKFRAAQRALDMVRRALQIA